MQPLHERGDQLALGSGGRAEDADDRQPTRLLRACCLSPCGRGAAENGDELAPPHRLASWMTRLPRKSTSATSSPASSSRWRDGGFGVFARVRLRDRPAARTVCHLGVAHGRIGYPRHRGLNGSRHRQFHICCRVVVDATHTGQDAAARAESKSPTRPIQRIHWRRFETIYRRGT